MNFENTLTIGKGCYTAPEIAHILQIPYDKVRRYMLTYWDGTLGKAFGKKYSWEVDNSRAVSFHTLVEFYVMMQLAEAGVKTKDVLKAHLELSKKHNTAFPFAQKDLLQGINTDGKKIFLTIGEDTLSLDGTNQFNLILIKQFFKNLEFDGAEMASKFWPMGKGTSVVVDPHRKFGHPVLNSKNIYPEVLHNHILAGDPIPYIALIFEISEKEVEDAIQYCDRNKAA